MIAAHPTNPHGVLVPCAVCEKPIHIPRSEVNRIDAANIACSSACADILYPLPR